MIVTKGEMSELIERLAKNEFAHEDGEGTIWVPLDVIEEEIQRASEAATSLA